MKFKGTLIGPASGSIAGMTASRNKGGQYFRARATPVNPNTGNQVAARNALGGLAQRWRLTLDDELRLGWQTYADNTPWTDAFGDPLQLSGQQAYIACNTPRVRTLIAPVDIPPTSFGYTPLGPITPTALTVASVPELDIEFTATDQWNILTGGFLLIQASQPKSLTTNYFKGPFTYSNKLIGSTGTPLTSPQTVSLPGITSALDTVTFFRFRSVATDGRLSTPQIVRFRNV